MNNEGLTRLLLGERFTHNLYMEISEKKETHFRELIKGNVELLPGVLKLLDALSQSSIPQAIGSSAPQANIDAIVSELTIENYFQAKISAVGMPSKPNLAVYLVAAESLEVSPKQCVVIEDAITGVEAARKAGMRYVAVVTTNPALELSSADLVVDRLDEISIEDLRDL